MNTPRDTVYSDVEIEEELKGLLGWTLQDGWIRRSYTTPGWAHTMMLVNTIGFLSDAAYHHPDLNVGYAKVTVKLQTHRVRGITDHDFELARRIEEIVTWTPPDSSCLDGYPKKWVS